MPILYFVVGYTSSKNGRSSTDDRCAVLGGRCDLGGKADRWIHVRGKVAMPAVVAIIRYLPYQSFSWTSFTAGNRV